MMRCKLNMKYNPLVWAFILGPLVLISSCTTDFNTNAPYKDVPVIHAVFTQEIVKTFKSDISYNPSKYVITQQDFKITKVFQGSGNYYDYAKIWDSVYYPVGVLDVEIENIDGKGTVKLPFKYEVVDNKESGDFVFPQQAVYRLGSEFVELIKTPVKGANKETTLKLKIYNNSRKEEATATTTLIPEFAVGVNSLVLPSLYFNFDISKPNLTTSVLAETSKNTGRVSAKFIYEYSETPKSGGNTEVKSVVWDWGYQTVGGSESVKFSIGNNNFYEMLASNIPRNGDVNRVSHNICYLVVDAYTTDVNNYIVANDPSNANLSGTGIFTNINNGIGVLGARLIQKQEFRLDQRTVTEIKKLFTGIDHSFDN